MYRNKTAIRTLALALTAAAMGCAEPDRTDDDERIADTTQAFSRGMGAVVSLGAPLGQARANAQPQSNQSVEGSVSSYGLVTDPSCIAYQWYGLSLTATFTDCELTVTGASLDGAVTLAVSLAPIGVTVAFADLMIDDNALDGRLALFLLGLSTQIEADVALSVDDGDMSMAVHQLFVNVQPGAVTASGAVDIHALANDATVELADVAWNGWCHPVGGAIGFEVGGQEVNVGFLPTTPADGIVEVTIGSGDPRMLRLLRPCAG